MTKLAESEEDLLEHRTDDTDAFGTLYIGCEKFPVHSAAAFYISGWCEFTYSLSSNHLWLHLFFLCVLLPLGYLYVVGLQMMQSAILQQALLA